MHSLVHLLVGALIGGWFVVRLHADATAAPQLMTTGPMDRESALEALAGGGDAEEDGDEELLLVDDSSDEEGGSSSNNAKSTPSKSTK